MYLSHFGLSRFPFRIAPDPAFLFWTADHSRALDLLTRAACRAGSVASIVGEPGTGKTTLLRHFMAGLPPEMRVGMISNHARGRGGVGRWLHYAFDLRPQTPQDASCAAFEAHLVAWHRDGTQCLLIVDEAQNVSDDDVLALTELTQLAAVPAASMRLVLSGQPRLDQRLSAWPDLGDGAASAPVHIGAMTSRDLAGYVHHRMATAGCLEQVFDDAATDRIARLTGGVPRLVNVLCEVLLISAFDMGARRIDVPLIERVLQDIRQTGMLDHLLVEQCPTEPLVSFVRPASPLPPLSPAADAIPAPVVGLPIRPAALPVVPSPLRPDALLVPTDTPAALDLHVAGSLVAVVQQPPGPRNRRFGRGLIAAGIAAGVGAVVVLPDWPGAPGPLPPATAQVGPALSAPSSLQGTDADALLKQALTIGARDPQGAAIGLARAALRGNDRAALYLGQHFEAGDGVPRNGALAAAWYGSVAQTQRGARRALQDLTGTTEATVQEAFAPARPLLGTTGIGAPTEVFWAAPDGSAALYLVELAVGPDLHVQAHGPFEVSAALLGPAAAARVWRVVSLTADGARIGSSDWHLLATDELLAVDAAH